MRVIRPLLTCFAVFCFFSNIVFSQSDSPSSIYYDSKVLSDFLENYPIPKIYFDIARGNPGKPIINKNDQKVENINENNFQRFNLTSYGYYRIGMSNPKYNDTIHISVNDTTFKISPIVRKQDGLDKSVDSLDAIVIGYYPGSLGIIVFNHTKGVQVIDENENGEPIFENFEDPPYSNHIYQKGSGVDEYTNILNILTAQTGDLLAGKEVNWSIKNIQSKYLTNPFLNNLNRANPLLEPSIENYFSPDFSENFAQNFSQNYYSNYPYQKLLYGDSILNFQKTVSFKDASISYRKQITTSQNELTDASVRINQTSRNKGFLDAKTVAVGLSDFIAERAQEELNLTFFNRFKENLEKPSELTVLFPSTKTLLYNFEISNYKTLLSHARKSFQVDLDNLGLNFPKILKLNKYKKLYNSPEVFNLSLIYSIADLAYKEEPVENILIASFQKLQERKKELKKSINIELADNFIAEVKPQEAKNYKVTPKDVSRNEELKKMKKYVDEYLAAVGESNRIMFNNYHYKLKGIYISSMPDGDDSDDVSDFTLESSMKIDEKSRVTSDAFYRPIQYNNRKISENSILNFYRETINANLDGKQYYGYLMDNPSPEDYQLYFKTPPDSINSIIAEGIEGSRNLMEENFEEILDDYYHFIQNFSADYRAMVKKDILKKEAEFGPSKKILHLEEQVDLLESAIDQEIIFWEKLTNLDKTDHHIAGLHFLKALIQRDPQISLFLFVANDIKGGADYQKLVKDFYSKSLGEEFEKNMNLATNQLDSIHADFKDKINSLTAEYGNINFKDSIYQHQLLDAQIQSDLAKFDLESGKKMVIYNQQLRFLEGVMTGRPLTKQRIPYYEIAAPELAKVVKTIFANYEKIDTLSQQSRALNDQLVNVTDPTEKENIDKQLEQLTDKIDTIEKENNTIFEENIEKVTRIIEEKSAALTPQKEALLEKHKALKDSLNNINLSSLRPLRQVYSLDNNNSLKEYLYSKENVNAINFYERIEMKDVNKLDVELEKTKTVLKNLHTKRVQLENHFTRLDSTYCKDLVDAQKNASNLAKSLEFSTHLLFAFRDYQKTYDPVFVYDSSYFKVTINQLDAATGLTNTITKDSLVIKKDTLEGTTKKLVAARWITRKEFDELRSNELQWNIFLGLLYQRLNTIEDAPNFSAQGIALLATKFLSITHDMDTYRTDLRIKKATTPDLVTFKDYYPFIRSTVDLFNTVISTPSIGDSTATISKKFELQNIPLISNEALSLYENIYAKNYDNAILNSMQLLKIITEKKRQNRKNKKDKRNAKKEDRKSQLAINAVLTYGTFMANMIKAESSDQVKNILKSATLPPGSSRIKRETVSSFTINSYLGVAAGRDRLLSVPDNLDLKQDAFGASLSVPIGFTYSFSPNLIKNNSSFSIHVPLLDLGAITAYRQNSDNPNYSIDDLPDFSWQNLFSPGAFVVYNFANSPFSAGVGGQYGPQLRQITPTGGEAINVNSWRFPMAFFTIDVPFFNLHTGARKIIVD